jgi:hypothetical protein
MGRPATALAAGLACLAVTLAIVPLGGAATASAPRAADVTKLFPKAVKKVRAARHGAFSEAVMLEADGLPDGTAPVADASGITNWRFILDNEKTKGSKFFSVYVDYTAEDGFGKVKGVEEPFVEDWRIKEAPRMTLAEAVSLMRDAGYTDPFANVTLRRPILQEGKTPPLYIFGFDGNTYVAVDTKSGAVSPF